MNEVNRERSGLTAASSVCDSAKHNGLVTSVAHWLAHLLCVQETGFESWWRKKTAVVIFGFYCGHLNGLEVELASKLGNQKPYCSQIEPLPD